MAFIFADSFESCTSGTDLTLRWTSATGSPSISTGTFKDGTRALSMDATERLNKSFGSAKEYVFISMWWRRDHSSDSGTLVRYYQGASAGAEFQITSGNNFRFINAVSTQVGIGTTTINANQWYHLEVKFRCDTSIAANDCILKVDGVEEINVAAGSNTQSVLTGSINQIDLMSSGTASANYFFDSIVVWDETTAAGDGFSDFLGPLRIEVLKPNGNGNANNFTGSDADSTDNYLHVDEIPGVHDGDTSYTESSTVTHKDQYAFGNITGTINTIYGVQAVLLARKTDAGARGVKQITRTGGSDYQGAEHTLTESYAAYTNLWYDNPNTSTNWSESEVNGAEFGVEITT